MTTQEDFMVMHEFVAPARKALSDEHWDYLMGGAETETAYRRNRVALESLAFRHRVLRDVTQVDTSGELLGHTLRLPVILAPIGSLQDLVDGGGLPPARAAARYGAMHMLSCVAKPGLEETAKSVDYPKIFQIYVRGDQQWVDDLTARAIDHGYAAICYTVDLDYYGRRERDKAKRYLPTARHAHAGDEHQMSFSWKDVERIRSKFDIPLILKGIADPRDAVMAADMGIEIVYVSNHGGRQLDHALGSVDVLPEIVDALAGRAKVIVDGGIMRGTDIVKAMALGADAVGIGRLQGLAAAAAGEDGLVRMFELLEEETRITLGLLGVNSLAELDASYVEKVPPLADHAWHSAFPLIEEGY